MVACACARSLYCVLQTLLIPLHFPSPCSPRLQVTRSGYEPIPSGNSRREIGHKMSGHSRRKHVKRHVDFYMRHFGFYSPFRVLVDGTFLSAAIHSLKSHDAVRASLRRLLDDDGALAVTVEEVCLELKKVSQAMPDNSDVLEAYFLAERLGRVRTMEETPVSQSQPASSAEKTGREAGPAPGARSTVELLKSIVSRGGRNSDRFFLATQVASLREFARSLPGVPILYVDHGVIQLEAPSRQSLLEVARQDEEHMRPKGAERERLEREKERSRPALKSAKAGRKPHMRQKGKNPLSSLRPKAERELSKQRRLEKKLRIQEWKRQRRTERRTGSNAAASSPALGQKRDRDDHAA